MKMSIRASTLLARSERALTQFIQKNKFDATSTTLFCLNAPQNVLQNAFDQLTKTSKTSSRVIGCLSDPLSLASTSKSKGYPISLSLLNIPKSVDHVVWRSTIPGREKAQVGRWYSQEQIHRERTDDSSQLPSNLRPQNDIPMVLDLLVPAFCRTSGFVFLTDDAPEGLNTSLSHYFPGVPKLGLLASSTPFITGRPFTLYDSGTFYSDGALGIVFLGLEFTSRNNRTMKSTTHFDRLEPLGPAFSVTKSSSNVLYAIDNKPAAEVLAKELQKLDGFSNSMSRENNKIFLGVYRAEADGKGDGEQVYRTFSISAGSPSRGALLLEGDICPLPGSRAQFFRVSANANNTNHGSQIPPIVSSSLLANKANGKTPSIAFSCVPPAEEDSTNSISQNKQSADLDLDGDDHIVYESVFAAASENGFVLDEGDEQGDKTEKTDQHSIWRCNTPYATGTLGL